MTGSSGTPDSRCSFVGGPFEPYWRRMRCQLKASDPDHFPRGRSVVQTPKVNPRVHQGWMLGSTGVYYFLDSGALTDEFGYESIDEWERHLIAKGRIKPRRVA